MAITLVTPPAIEPVTVAEAKAHIHVTGSDDDAYIAYLIRTARQMVEDYTGRALLTQTWKRTMDRFPCGRIISLERPPLIDVTAFKWLDFNLVQQDIDPTIYRLSKLSTPGRIILRFGYVWPIVAYEGETVEITYQAGYGTDPKLVPTPLIEAILYFVGNMYANREPVITGLRAQAAEVPQSLQLALMPYQVHF